MKKGERESQKVIIAVLSIAVIVLTFFLIQKEEKFVNEYPLIDPARSLIGQEHFIVNIQPLREDLYAIAAESSHDIGIYFEFLNTGANISVNQEMRFWPASLSKMPTAISVMKKIETGEWDLQNELVMYQDDRDNSFGTLYQNPVGSTFTIERLLEELLINSDDSAHRILVRNLTGVDYDNLLSGLGMEDLFDKQYDITAKEYTRIFRALYNSSYLRRQYSEQLLTWLSQTQFDTFLGAGIPDDVIFSHKIGIHEPESTYLDSGIVYIPNRPYMMTVMIRIKEGENPQQQAEEIAALISQKAYDYVSSY